MTSPKPDSAENVKRINIGYVYKLNQRLHPLTQWAGEKERLMTYYAATTVRGVLEELFNNGNFYGLLSSWPSANRLYDLLERHANPNPDQMNVNVTEVEVRAIAQAATEFEIALIEEFGVLPAYLVTPKGGYSIDVLTRAPQQLFPADLLQFVPDAKHDVEEAGKCLAFEAPTAAGFHLHRINESVLRVYWNVVTKNAKPPEQASMGVYLAALRKKKKGDAKTLATLKQIKDLHRNPILHPDLSLSVEESIELYGIIRSAINRMLTTIRKSVPTPAPEASTGSLQTSSARLSPANKY